MDRRELRKRKGAPKSLRGLEFKPLRRGALPKPLKELGGPRLTASRLLDVGSGMKVVFIVRSGDALERRAFLGYLFEGHEGALVPLAILHYHPSHKGIHMLVNCETDRDFTGRQLPGAPELALKTARALDPMDPNDRNELVLVFCKRCNIAIGDELPQLPL